MAIYKLPLGLHRQFQKSELVALARPIIKVLKMKKQLHSFIYTIRNLLIRLNSSDNTISEILITKGMVWPGSSH